MARPIVGNASDEREQPLQSINRGQLEKRVIGFGSAKAGTVAGRMRAVYAEIDLTNVPDLTNVVIRHSLGEKPTVCEYAESRNSAGAVFASITPVRKDQWTHTTVRVAINLTGTQAGTVLKVRVGGE